VGTVDPGRKSASPKYFTTQVSMINVFRNSIEKVDFYSFSRL